MWCREDQEEVPQPDAEVSSGRSGIGPAGTDQAGAADE